MINPILFSFEIFGVSLSLSWYGILSMLGVFSGAWLASVELKRRGEDEEYLWDALVVLILVGYLGARLWYVANATLGGSAYYIENPGQILNIPQGGLHFYGGMLFGAAGLFWYAKKHKLDMWLLLDSLAPAALVGQAVARPANFINQELYGQPTTLPWGIAIDKFHRIFPYNDLSLYPESTRFHPAFAYEMIWNFLAAGLILWWLRKNPAKDKPGAGFGAWLIMAGIGRFWLEAFRPDQPRIPGTEVSFTRVVALLMALVGLLILLVRYEIIKLPFVKNWRESYMIAPRRAVPAEKPKKKKASVQEKRRRRKR